MYISYSAIDTMTHSNIVVAYHVRDVANYWRVEELRRLGARKKLAELLYSEKVVYMTVEGFEGFRKELSRELESL
jgi:hypothetical protein